MEKSHFFTHEGKITILEADQNNMHGRMKLKLANPSGKQIALQGNFIALKKE